MKLATALKLVRFWPPYWGAGISVTSFDKGFKWIEVQLKMRFWNKNYVGTHFGGSLYAMADPFYMLMLLERLGKEFIVWDKAATIKFVKPGKGLVKARFEISEDQLDQIRQQALEQEKIEPVFSTEIKDEEGAVIAWVEKKLYVKKKNVE